MRQIPLRGGQVTLVDDADFEYLSRFGWYNAGGYARRVDRPYTYLHHLLIDVPDGLQADHINGNSLDNQRANLRIATWRQNQQNGRKRISMCGNPTSSQYKGVHYHKRDGCWHVRIRDNEGRRLWLGSFKHEEDAGRAYREAAQRIHGEFARV